MISKTKYPVTNSQIKEMFIKAGFSKVTDIFPLGDGEYNSVYSVKADEKEYAIKIAPSTDCEVLTYEKNMLKAELYWYEIVSSNTNICAPKIIYSDASRDIIDTDWFIMEKINGKALRHCKLEGDEKTESEHALIDMLVQMHSIKGEKFGYPEGEKFDNWYLALKSIINNLISDCDKKGYKCKHGKKMLSALEKYKDIFSAVDCSLVNYDLHTGNVIYSPQNAKGKYWIIDLERGFWGDKVFDFVSFDMMNTIENKTSTLEYYNKIAKEKIIADDGVKIRYAMAEALMGLLMETEKYYRYTLFHFGWWRNVFAGMYLFNSAFKVLK